VINLLLLAPIAMQIVHLLLADSVWISYILRAASVLSVGSAFPRNRADSFSRRPVAGSA